MGWMDRDGRTDGRTDEQTNKQTDRWMQLHAFHNNILFSQTWKYILSFKFVHTIRNFLKLLSPLTVLTSNNLFYRTRKLPSRSGYNESWLAPTDTTLHFGFDMESQIWNLLSKVESGVKKLVLSPELCPTWLYKNDLLMIYLGKLQPVRTLAGPQWWSHCCLSLSRRRLFLHNRSWSSLVSDK